MSNEKPQFRYEKSLKMPDDSFYEHTKSLEEQILKQHHLNIIQGSRDVKIEGEQQRNYMIGERKLDKGVITARSSVEEFTTIRHSSEQELDFKKASAHGYLQAMKPSRNSPFQDQKSPSCTAGQ